MTHDEPKNLVAQGRVILQPTAAKLEHGIRDGVIWPSATAKRTRHVVLGNEGIKMKKITRSF